MGIGIWLFIIGIVIVIVGIVLYYFTSFVSITYFWLILGLGILLIIVGAFMFFFQKKKPAPKSKEEKKEPVPPPMPYPMYPPPEPQVIQAPAQQGGISPEVLLLLQQQNEKYNDLKSKMDKDKENERVRVLEKKLESLSKQSQQPPQVLLPQQGGGFIPMQANPIMRYPNPQMQYQNQGQGQYQQIPQQIQPQGQYQQIPQGQGQQMNQGQGQQFVPIKYQAAKAFLDPQLIQSGLQSGTQVAGILSNPEFIKLSRETGSAAVKGAKVASKGLSGLLRASSAVAK